MTSPHLTTEHIESPAHQQPDPPQLRTTKSGRRGLVALAVLLVLAFVALVLFVPLGLGASSSNRGPARVNAPVAPAPNTVDATRTWFKDVAGPDLASMKNYTEGYVRATKVYDLKGMADNCQLMVWLYTTMNAQAPAPDAELAGHWAKVIQYGVTSAGLCVQAVQGKTMATADSAKLGQSTAALSQQTEELNAVTARLSAMGLN